MSHDDPKTLVSTAWLADHLKDPDLRVLDASWYLPDAGRDGRAEYDAAHIPGARFFDIDDVSDQRSELPHMVPPTEKFMSRMRKLGVGDGHQIVAYDGAGLFKDVTQVAAASKLGDYVIVDARAPERFRGDAPEPREGLRSGHIPNSRNVFFRDLLNANGTMKDEDALRATFEGAGVDLAKPAILSCGSGVTASVLALAMERIGKTDHAVYDGSWSEWGTFQDLPIATGDA